MRNIVSLVFQPVQKRRGEATAREKDNAVGPGGPSQSDFLQHEVGGNLIVRGADSYSRADEELS